MAIPPIKYEQLKAESPLASPKVGFKNPNKKGTNEAMIKANIADKPTEVERYSGSITAKSVE